jgi:SanA protein
MPVLALFARGPARRRALVLGLLLGVVADLGWTLILLPGGTRGRWHDAAALAPTGAPALVLGSSLDRRGEPNAILAGRLRVALSLYETGKVPWILVSGYDRETAAMRHWLLQRGVPEAAIAADFAPRRTYDSLQRAVAAFGLRRVVVVTSDFHLPRALWLAAHLGLEAEGVAASTEAFPRAVRAGLDLREYAARNRAILDVWFPPRVPDGPREAAPIARDTDPSYGVQHSSLAAPGQ